MAPVDPRFTAPTDWVSIRVRRINPSDGHALDQTTIAVDHEVEVACVECKKPFVFRAGVEAQAGLPAFFESAPRQHHTPPILAAYVAMQLCMTAFCALCPACTPVQIVFPSKQILKP